MKQIVDKLNNIAKAIDENVELPTTDLIVDSLDAITRAYGGTPNDSNLIVDKLEAIAGVAHGGITPTGTIEITENGTYDVSNYAEADVDVVPAEERHYVIPEGTYTSMSFGEIYGVYIPGVYFFADTVHFIVDGVEHIGTKYFYQNNGQVSYFEAGSVIGFCDPDYMSLGQLSGTGVATPGDTQPTTHIISAYYTGEETTWLSVKSGPPMIVWGNTIENGESKLKFASMEVPKNSSNVNYSLPILTVHRGGIGLRLVDGIYGVGYPTGDSTTTLIDIKGATAATAIGTHNKYYTFTQENTGNLVYVFVSV